MILRALREGLGQGIEAEKEVTKTTLHLHFWPVGNAKSSSSLVSFPSAAPFICPEHLGRGPESGLLHCCPSAHVNISGPPLQQVLAYWASSHLHGDEQVRQWPLQKQVWSRGNNGPSCMEQVCGIQEGQASKTAHSPQEASSSSTLSSLTFSQELCWQLFTLSPNKPICTSEFHFNMRNGAVS
jgi:hypothetical protein